MTPPKPEPPPGRLISEGHGPMWPAELVIGALIVLALVAMILYVR